MPIYEYECNKCGRLTEAWQKFSDSPLANCPHCKGRLHKLMSLNSFHLKGSGWYVTDYARKSGGRQSGRCTTTEKHAKKEKSGTPEKGGADSDNSAKP